MTAQTPVRNPVKLFVLSSRLITFIGEISCSQSATRPPSNIREDTDVAKEDARNTAPKYRLISHVNQSWIYRGSNLHSMQAFLVAFLRVGTALKTPLVAGD